MNRHVCPDPGYRRSVRRLRAVFDLLGIMVAVLAVMVYEWRPFAAVLAGILSIGCLVVAAEAAEEIRRWE